MLSVNEIRISSLFHGIAASDFGQANNPTGGRSDVAIRSRKLTSGISRPARSAATDIAVRLSQNSAALPTWLAKRIM